MKGYAQIYMNKKHEKNRKSNNSSSLNQSRETIKSSSLNIQQSNTNNQNNQIPPNNKITERNASILTFSNLNANSNRETFKISENFNNNKNEENSLINKINISEKKEPIIDIGKNKIKYRQNMKIKNKENSLNFIDDNYIDNDMIINNDMMINNVNNVNNVNNKISVNGKEKLKQKLIEKEKKLQKEKENNYKNKINKTSPGKSGEKNNKSNNSKNKNKNNNKINKNNNNINNKINNGKNNNKPNDIVIDDEISIYSEGSNNVVYETKYIKNNNDINNHINENINLVKESKEKILTKEEILFSTHIIFLNNASFIKKQNQYMMSKSNFLNILKSLNLITSQQILVEIDLIFNYISPKSPMIIYSQFNQILLKIIETLYPEKYKISPKLTINYFLNKLITHYNLYFKNKIPKDYLYKYQYNSIVKLLQIFPNENQLFILNEISLTLNEIYEKYFIYELNYNHDHIYKSSENLNKFCVDFEIVPRTINSTQAMTYYNLSIHINEVYNYTNNEMKKFKNFKNKGIIFTLIHFMMFIIHVSLYSYTKIFGSKTWTIDDNENIITNEAKLILFLEKLEHSKGMNNFMNLLSTPRNKPLTLVPSREICSSLGIFDIYKKKVKEKQFLDDIFLSEKNKDKGVIKDKEIEGNNIKKEEELITD